MDLKAVWTDLDRKATLNECERGEDYAVKAFKKAMDDEIDSRRRQGLDRRPCTPTSNRPRQHQNDARLRVSGVCKLLGLAFRFAHCDAPGRFVLLSLQYSSRNPNVTPTP